MNPTPTVHSPLRLYGRSGELALIDGLLARHRDSTGGSLVIVAPPGLGRSALVRHAVEAQGDRSVLYTRAVPAEAGLPYSGLHALLSSAPGPIPRWASDMMRGGLRPTVLVGLLRALASRRPLLVCVDDAHAWDPDSRLALAFALRRLTPADRVAALVTLTDGPYETTPHAGDRGGAPPGGESGRLGESRAQFAGLAELRLAPLDEPAADDLCTELAGPGSDSVVRDALCREAAGNPRLLTDLVHALTPDQLAGEAPVPHPLPGGGAVLDAYTVRADALNADTRLMLLLAAAAHEHDAGDDGVDLALLQHAARRAGADPESLTAAERAGLITTDGRRLRFPHPLVRTALLRRSAAARRHAAHRLLATALAAPHEELPRLVQRSLAATGCAPALADALAAVAVEPRPQGERALALARAADLTPDAAGRDARFAAAAELALLGGASGRSRALLARVRAVPAPGRAHYVRGLLALRDGPVGDAHESLLTAASLLSADDPGRAVGSLLGAAEAAWAMGDATLLTEVLHRLPGQDGAPPPQPDPMAAPDPGSALAAYRDGMLAMFGGRTGSGKQLLRYCIEASLRASDASEVMRGGVAALVVGDVAASCRAGARALAVVRAHGPEAQLPQALEHLAYGELRAGRHAPARARAQEGLRAAARLGQRNIATHLHAVLALSASVTGDGDTCALHAEAAVQGAGPHGLSQATTLATWALARADLARGMPAEAVARLLPLVRRGPRRGHFAARMLAVPCLVEAAALAGRTGEVLGSVEEFAHWTAHTADPLAPAQLARCRALVASAEEGSDAADHYTEAIAHHDRAGGDFERARTLLLYGYWLRRRRRTREARGPLRDALVAFERCGARIWAERASGELRAAGEAVAGDSADGPLDLLTPQQRRIARQVAEGATNREVAVRLSVSTRTVDHHLRNVYSTLGVRSRTELARFLRQSAPELHRDRVRPTGR
ncbi:putative HTH-type transcriptional regulator [Streptomyces sp. YIM 130001]|uniref:helix-turn-helix transcriptional regulator n=1 Tax=Streptomyces sp. YIM 130001 TaxID=2259644 RepID=UPI000EB8F746|nr:LuxR family transcriptional regulator [Streptomyces sp. YIM 130001]RII20341.1 putative HTH-type transcriptional regulator [Streptomyces sp. YIM 130001]